MDGHRTSEIYISTLHTFHSILVTSYIEGIKYPTKEAENEFISEVALFTGTIMALL